MFVRRWMLRPLAGCADATQVVSSKSPSPQVSNCPRPVEPKASAPAVLPSLGDHVIAVVQGADVPATVRFIGEANFREGIWVGLETDTLEEKANDGTVNGVRYFDCPPMHGLFVRPGMLRNNEHINAPSLSSKAPASPALSTPSSGGAPPASPRPQGGQPGGGPP
jgi:hypothetical protein